MKDKKCIGFGKYEGRCTNIVDITCSKFWCRRCEELRRKTITKQMEGIANSFKQGNSE